MLLEVLLSVALLVLGLAVVGRQLNAGLHSAERTEIGMRAAMLLDNKFDELAAGAIMPDEPFPNEFKGDFWTLDSIVGGRSVQESVAGEEPLVGGRWPGFTWRMRFEESQDIDNLYMVVIQIGYNAGAALEMADSPDYELDIDDKGTHIVREAYRLWVRPAGANFQNDFGFQDEQIEQMLAMMMGMGGGIPGDGEGGIPGEGAGEIPGGIPGGVPGGGTDSADLGTLQDFLDLYLETGELDFDAIKQLPLEDQQFLMLMRFLETLYGRGDAEQLQRQMQQFMGRQGRPGGPGRGRDGDRGGPPGEPPMGRDRARGGNNRPGNSDGGNAPPPPPGG